MAIQFKAKIKQYLNAIAQADISLETSRSVLLIQYCAGDKIEKNEMGWACGAYGWGEGDI